MCGFSVLFLSRQFRHLLKSGNHIIIAACTVRDQTTGAILDSLIRIREVSSTLISQRIQRAITKQAIEPGIV
jgi:hypothetical protein